MEPKKGWMIATIVLAVLLVGALVALGVVLAAQSDGDDGKADAEKIAELETKIEELEDELIEANAEAAAARYEAQNAAGAASGSNSSSGSSGGGSGTEVVSDREQLEALALSVAEGYDSDVAWQAGETVIDGDWARVSVGCPSDHTVQGDNLYFHKVGGSWQYVTCGTGLCYGDIPGAPESIFP